MIFAFRFSETSKDFKVEVFVVPERRKKQVTQRTIFILAILEENDALKIYMIISSHKLLTVR